MIDKLLTEHHLEFLSLKGGCRGSSEPTLVKLLEISCPGSNYYRIINKDRFLYGLSGDEIKFVGSEDDTSVSVTCSGSYR